ncbi:MAG: isoprenylcysteine carboxylmethyltransferase family protein [Gammaproteobacteria bacterium]|nr:isoprenylcysteine carboxylmethyltransferase family protein [Gammaproteobacteria bacterium]
MLQSIHNIFNQPALRKLFLKVRYVLALVLVLVLLKTMHSELMLAAFLVSLFGEAIQLWSFASLVKNRELTARGPYVMVRNPMYLGRYFLVLGFVILFGNIYVVVGYTVLYYFYMVNRVKREEKHLQELIGEPYIRFCQDTNRFLPSLSRLLNKDVRFFSWQVMVSNNGHWNLLSMLAVYAALYGYTLYMGAR